MRGSRSQGQHSTKKFEKFQRFLNFFNVLAGLEHAILYKSAKMQHTKDD
jgi:hypothetical protein